MTQAKEEQKAIARTLRAEGWSYNQIVTELNVSKSSVSLWCRDIALTEEQEQVLVERRLQGASSGKGGQTNKARAIEVRRGYQEQGRIKAHEGDNLHLLGCMLYWAEGAKNRRNNVHFANSDPQMMGLFMRFLRECFSISDTLMHIQIHCHVDNDKAQLETENYWLTLLNLPRTALYRTQRLKSAGRTTHYLEYGVCSLQVNSTELLQQILGAIQEYGGFDNPAWLE